LSPLITFPSVTWTNLIYSSAPKERSNIYVYTYTHMCMYIGMKLRHCLSDDIFIMLMISAWHWHVFVRSSNRQA